MERLLSSLVASAVLANALVVNCCFCDHHDHTSSSNVKSGGAIGVDKLHSASHHDHSTADHFHYDEQHHKSAPAEQCDCCLRRCHGLLASNRPLELKSECVVEFLNSLQFDAGVVPGQATGWRCAFVVWSPHSVGVRAYLAKSVLLL